MRQCSFSRASPWQAIWPLLLGRERYLHMAAAHEIAVSLRSADYRAAYEKGEYPQPGWEPAALERAKHHMQALFRGLRQSFFLTLVFASLGLAVAFAFGKVNPCLPFATGKLLSIVGALLAAWATLFELGGYVKTWDGESLHELLHPVFFKIMFLSGLGIATIGQLW